MSPLALISVRLQKPSLEKHDVNYKYTTWYEGKTAFTDSLGSRAFFYQLGFDAGSDILRVNESKHL